MKLIWWEGRAVAGETRPHRQWLTRNAWCETNRLLWGAKCLVKQPLTGLCSHPQPPLVQTQTVTITAVSNSLPSVISTTEVPVIPTKTFIYESSKVGAPAPAQPRSVSAISSLHGGRCQHCRASRSGRIRPGAPEWAWGGAAPSHYLKIDSLLTFFGVFFFFFFLRWLMMGQTIKTAQLCPAPRP